MADIKVPKIDGVELRRRAEGLLAEITETAHTPGTAAEPLRLLHELQMHQIELEMQNAELRQARNELDTVLEKYADLYDSAPAGYFTLDRNGIIRAANLTGAGLMGVERSRLIGRRFDRFVSVNNRSALSVFLGKVFGSPTKEACEVAFLKEGGSELIAQIEGVAAASTEECRIVLIDITDRKRAAEELRLAKETAVSLRLANEAAETTARTKSQFLANMSHELRTPMTVVFGMLDVLLLGNLEAEQREFIKTAQTSAHSLLRILNDILDMAKIEAEKLAVEEIPFSPRNCITEVVDIITPEVQRKGLAITVSVADEVPDTLVGDSVRLRQVLINLVGNAVKFTEVGKITVRLTAAETNAAGRREFTFVVTDTGIGIPADKNDLLFHSFSQVDASHSRRYGGAGLGLVICKRIVELMEGAIAFKSKEGVGSCFSFTIPLAETSLECAAPTAVESFSTETITASEGERVPHLLLAEDDPTIRHILEIILKRSHYDLDIAEDGQKAVEMWEKGEYDLVLMDVQMPRFTGFEATQAIRKKERARGGHTPIVAMTAHTRKEDEQSCLAAGMDAFISKPVVFKECLQLIGQLVRQNLSGVNRQDNQGRPVLAV